MRKIKIVYVIKNKYNEYLNILKNAFTNDIKFACMFDNKILAQDKANEYKNCKVKTIIMWEM